LIGASGDALNTPVLIWLGVRAEAEAGLAGGRGERETARAGAAALAGSLERLLGESCPPQGSAYLAAAGAELGRLDCEPRAERWKKVAAAWEAIDQPYPAAYARLRWAGALAAEGEHDAARRLLDGVCAVAAGLGAGFLLAEAGRLSAVAGERRAPPLEGRQISK
jgi:hypothetical protein